jgi:hypothetical protein
MSDSQRILLRHAVATIAYRGGKTIRGAPDGFASFRISEASRSPLDIVAHAGDLFDWALSLARGAQEWHDSTPGSWSKEVARLFGAIASFDAYLASNAPLAASPERLLQGPVADALTHVGQLAMLRRLAGAPIRGENYYKAEVVVGRVGPDQSEPRREFD